MPKAHKTNTRGQMRKRRPARGGVTRWVVLIAFCGALLTLGALGITPDWVPALYVLMSVLTYAAYALDKYAAEHDAWRTRERSLHLLALLCGWPGALLAQHLLRHKSAKPEFLRIFYLIAVINAVVLAALTAAEASRTHDYR
jgi:uncharacterized membrane protein YsdA (DUF1294 family)